MEYKKILEHFVDKANATGDTIIITEEVMAVIREFDDNDEFLCDLEIARSQLNRGGIITDEEFWAAEAANINE